MIFTLPWALIGLAALPAAAAIYLFRSRSRPQPVSSLLLWTDVTRPRGGGRILKRPQTPLLLLLELAALALLALGAAGPRVRTAAGGRPVVVVLDDSFSMRAGGEDSPRARAVEAVREVLRDEPDAWVQFIAAGAEPQILGQGVRTASAAEAVLADWECLGAESALAPAVALARRLGAGVGRVLVLTDHPPPHPPQPRTVWRSLGPRRPNRAIVHAARSDGPDGARCLIEVANFADRPASVALRVRAAGEARVLARRVLALEAGGRTPVFVDLPAGAGAVRAVLDDDALALDNQAVLLPESARPVRVALEVRSAALRTALERALEAAGRARITRLRPQRGPNGPDLLLYDWPAPPAGAPGAWPVRFVVDAETDARAYVGPFVLDRSHPLCQGVALGGVIWAAGKSPPLPGTPVIAAGDVSLVTDRPLGRQRHLAIRLQPALSNLTESINWPVLIWNLLEYRAGRLPGPGAGNARLGAEVAVVTDPDVAEAVVRGPDGRERPAAVHDGRLTVAAGRPGVYEVRAGEQTFRFAANPLAPGESDLRGCAAGRWGGWQPAGEEAEGTRSMAWLAALAALGVLAAHLALAGPYGPGRGRPVKERAA